VALFERGQLFAQALQVVLVHGNFVLQVANAFEMTLDFSACLRRHQWLLRRHGIRAGGKRDAHGTNAIRQLPLFIEFRPGGDQHVFLGLQFTFEDASPGFCLALLGKLSH